jgi:hypothetical protein
MTKLTNKTICIILGLGRACVRSDLRRGGLRWIPTCTLVNLYSSIASIPSFPAEKGLCRGSLHAVADFDDNLELMTDEPI